MHEIMISICVPTYNHEKYICQALDSIYMQKTQYSYEVLVGEDCSTDNTRAVLKEWERTHPGNYQFFYRPTNMFSSEITNSTDLKLRARGKYIIILEGDDFWTDPEKLEKQVTFLENHPEYYAVAHNCVVVGADSKPNGETYPQCTDSEYTLRHFASDIMPGQLTTVLCRNYMRDESFDHTLITEKIGPGDRKLYFSLASLRRVYCMQECMSAYRHITAGGSSYSARYVHEYAKEEPPLRQRVEFARKIGNKEAILCAELQYVLYIRHALLHKYIGIKNAWTELNRIHRWYRLLLLMLKRDINCFLLHKIPYV